MKRKITVLFFLLFLPMIVFAGTTGKIKGKVTDLQTGEPLIGANIVVVGTSFGAATDIKGEYAISNLDAGVYELKASYLGYKTVTISNVRVNADLTAEINFQLPATGVAVGEVEIVAKRPLINKSNTNAIRTTTNEQIESLPIRGVDNIIALTPGVILQNNTIYVRGGRQDEVGYYLEGTNITSALNGSRQVYLSQDALEEVSVQAGGYTAEFGGANAGIIRTQLRSGGPILKASLQYITDNWTFKSAKNRYDGKKNLGTYSYGYNDFTATLSGPITEKIKFFGLFQNLTQADETPQPGDGFNFGLVGDPNTGDTITVKYPGGPDPGANTNRYTGTGTITLDFNPIVVRILGNFSARTSRGNGGVWNMFDLNRQGITDLSNGDFGFKVTHILSPNTYYEISGGYIFNQSKTYDPLLKDSFLTYGDSVANAQAGAVWNRRAREVNASYYGRYLQPLPYELFALTGFTAPNAETSTFNKSRSQNINLSASFSSQLSKEHSLKFGGEIQLMTFSNFSFSRHPNGLANAIVNSPSLSIHQIEVNQGINNYGYDLDGNVYTGSSNYVSGQIAPKKPVFAGVYVEDRMEYKNLIVNAGIRYDYIKTDNDIMVDPVHPEKTIDFNSGAINPAGLVKTPSYSAISPRLGFSFPVTDQTVFHAQFGKFVQQSRLQDMYEGIYALAWQLRGGFFISTPVGLNVRPERTTQYEVGFTQQIGDFASFDITGYYKDIANQVIITNQNTQASPFGAFLALTNGDYATTRGVELSFNMRRTERLMVNGSISLQDAKGTGGDPYSNAGSFGNPIDPKYVFTPHFINPLAYNHAISGNLNFDYRFGKDDGPEVLQNFGVDLLLSFASGHPYTLGTGGFAIETDTRTRSPIEPINSSITPGTFQADLRIDKTVWIMDKISANIFIQVINLLNTKNIVNVFTRTGSATDDGYLNDPTLGLPIVEKYGPTYAAMYRAIMVDYGYGYTSNLYGSPRQIRLGLRLEY
ncbi:MAG: TonB-dependent receptor [Bacteroidetes bacterium]|nr:TonB-dependent receptor [Bacteroidota bacterium]